MSQGESMQVIRYEGGPEVIDAILPEWTALAAQAGNDEPFFHAEFLAAHIRAFAPTASLLVLVARQGRTVCAVLPLIREKVSMYGIPVWRLRAPVNHHSLRFDILRRRGDEGERGLEALWEHLRRTRFDLLELPDVPSAGAAERLLECAASEGFPVGRWESMRTPYIPLNSDANASFAHARHSLVVNVRKCNRKIVRELGKEPMLVRKHFPSAREIAAFYEIERSGWKGKKGTAIADLPAVRAFYDLCAEAAKTQGYFCLDELRSGNELIAAAYSFVLHRRYFALKWAYDERFHRYSPGHLLIEGILRRCIEEEYVEFDFMGPLMDYKAQWTSLLRPHSYLYVFGKSFAGRTVQQIKFGLIPRLRKMGIKHAGTTG